MGKQEKHRLWSIAMSCQRLARLARRAWRSRQAQDPVLLAEVELHLAAAGQRLDADSGPKMYVAPVAADIVQMTQRILQNEDQAHAQHPEQDGAPSAAHVLLLRAKPGLVSTPDFVAFLCQSHRSGILQVITDAEVFSIEVEDGDIVHAHSNGAPPGERLGDILVEQGVLTDADVERLLDGEQRSRFGNRVVEEQLVTHDELVAALEAQIRRLFYRLFAVEPRELLFWGGPCLLAEQSLRLNVNVLLLDCARAADEAARDHGG